MPPIPRHQPADQPLLDIDHFTELCDMLGSDQTETLLRAFLIDLDTRIPAIVSDCVADRHDAAKRSVHGLKGAALSIGARRVAMIAAGIERAADGERRSMCADLAPCATETRDLINALLPQA